ncbi:hypothetical protein RFI_32776 [Reticulomyxa filosa]|uniref:Uncharacterized protein n=1 Tax=Reticulomyxa filosa TaxID=46433 RepID=X6LSJ9_RETFI|nr:hypothetical protein RFI_32776 [Reticulomyxa filosa]|eukprot:ETO04619.1 hypothetical protein RFI_32776 [Reticulomyxa filosa]
MKLFYQVVCHYLFFFLKIIDSKTFYKQHFFSENDNCNTKLPSECIDPSPLQESNITPGQSQLPEENVEMREAQICSKPIENRTNDKLRNVPFLEKVESAFDDRTDCQLMTFKRWQVIVLVVQEYLKWMRFYRRAICEKVYGGNDSCYQRHIDQIIKIGNQCNGLIPCEIKQIYKSVIIKGSDDRYNTSQFRNWYILVMSYKQEHKDSMRCTYVTQELLVHNVCSRYGIPLLSTYVLSMNRFQEARKMLLTLKKYDVVKCVLMELSNNTQVQQKERLGLIVDVVPLDRNALAYSIYQCIEVVWLQKYNIFNETLQKYSSTYAMDINIGSQRNRFISPWCITQTLNFENNLYFVKFVQCEFKQLKVKEAHKHPNEWSKFINAIKILWLNSESTIQRGLVDYETIHVIGKLFFKEVNIFSQGGEITTKQNKDKQILSSVNFVQSVISRNTYIKMALFLVALTLKFFTTSIKKCNFNKYEINHDSKLTAIISKLFTTTLHKLNFIFKNVMILMKISDKSFNIEKFISIKKKVDFFVTGDSS